MRYQYLSAFLILTMLTGCLTSKNAPKRQYEIAARFPGVLAEAAARFFPPKPPVYLPGTVDTVLEVRVLTDSVTVACPPNLTDTLRITLPGTTQVRTVTITQHDTLEIDPYPYERAMLTEKLRASETEVAILESQVKRNNWWRWACLITWFLIAGGIVWKIAKPRII